MTDSPPSRCAEPSGSNGPSFLLIGPWDPHCGEYTFLAPPLGVWRLQGVLEQRGLLAEVFDPNCLDDNPGEVLDRILAERDWSVVGVSTTGMTLRYDLALAHRVRRALPDAVLVAGGMEATFEPESMFRLGPFDLVVLGEGEKPLLELAERWRSGEALDAVPGTARLVDGAVVRHHHSALTRDELREAIFATPYERMPYPTYWRRLEEAYRVGDLPHKAAREARLAEIRSVRLITLNYCPMACTFCSSTNFLHAAQGGIARIGRLGADEILEMCVRIVAAHPEVRTVIFQDDIFVFRNDDRILPLCEKLTEAKADGTLPHDLQFISTNRIDAMTEERLAAMRRAGFRVLGFGIESFSPAILKEFNKHRIQPYVEPMLTAALAEGITPFLDLILTSPRCRLEDLAETLRQAHRFIAAGCEVGMYPYVIPFSGAVMANDPELRPHTIHQRQQVLGTTVEWEQPAKILPVDPEVREAILAIEASFEKWLETVTPVVRHVPSRLRSLLWILAAIPVLRAAGERPPGLDEALDALLSHLPRHSELLEKQIRERARAADVSLAPRATRVRAG